MPGHGQPHLGGSFPGHGAELFSPVLGGFQLDIPVDRVEPNRHGFDGGSARLRADPVPGDGRAEAAPAVRAHSPSITSHRHPAGQYGAPSERGPSVLQIPSRRESAQSRA